MTLYVFCGHDVSVSYQAHAASALSRTLPLTRLTSTLPLQACLALLATAQDTCCLHLWLASLPPLPCQQPPPYYPCIHLCRSDAVATLEQLGHPHCAHLAPQEVVRRVGYHSMPHLALDRCVPPFYVLDFDLQGSTSD